MNHPHTTWHVHHELHTPNTRTTIARAECHNTVHAEQQVNRYRAHLPSAGKRITEVHTHGTSIRHDTVDGHIHYIHMMSTQNSI